MNKQTIKKTEKGGTCKSCCTDGQSLHVRNGKVFFNIDKSTEGLNVSYKNIKIPKVNFKKILSYFHLDSWSN